MLYAFLVENPEDNLILGIAGSPVPDLAYATSANPIYRGDGVTPMGVVAKDGQLYHAKPDLPALFVWDDGVEIREEYDVNHLANAKFVVAGAVVLLKNERSVPIPKQYNCQVYLQSDKLVNRVAVGIRSDGSLIHVVNNCTIREMAIALRGLGAVDALLLNPHNTYFDYKEVGHRMGTPTTTTLGATKAKELARPIVVIDPGHGGTDPGAVGFGLKEANINLFLAQNAVNYLVKNYEGSFLLTRKEDKSMTLEQRSDYCNSVDADYFLSIHVNAGGGTGFESFVYTKAGADTLKKQTSIHGTIMGYLAKYGVKDRGMKTANFHVLRKTKPPAMLIENLFIDTLKDVELLRKQDFLLGLANAIGEGVAKALGLQRVKTPVVTEPAKQKLYAVQSGAFKQRQNAEALVGKMKSAGFDAYIVTKEV